jgi:integrase
MRKTLTDRSVKLLKPRAKRYPVLDPELAGHYVRVQPTGAKAFAAVARDPHGKQVWATLGPTDVLTIADSRERAREAIRRIRDGLPAFEAPPVKPESYQHVAEQWLKRHVRANGLRSQGEVTRLLKMHVYPEWKGRAFRDIRRSDVAALLDRVEDDHGARQADYCLAITRQIAGWFAARHDDYVPPFVKGMRRTDPKSRARTRILSDDELRAVWHVAEVNGTYGALIRLLLLTAQRREKCVSMRWQDISIDGKWKIPQEAREKGAPAELVLPPVAVEIIRAQPQMGDNPFVFAGRGDTHVNGFSKSKRAFDAKLPTMERWTLHDLRRTARSLMARAGVPNDHAERVLGHARPGVEGVYDRHHYRDEVSVALSKLATLIDEIVHPHPRTNVTSIKTARGKSR